MKNTSSHNAPPVPERDVLYFRHRYQNRVFQSVMAYFETLAERDGLTKAQLAQALGKDPAQITRWFAVPGNWTLDTVSDLLLAMQAEMSDEVIPFQEMASNKAATSRAPQTLEVSDKDRITATTDRLRLKVAK